MFLGLLQKRFQRSLTTHGGRHQVINFSHFVKNRIKRCSIVGIRLSHFKTPSAHLPCRFNVRFRPPGRPNLGTLISSHLCGGETDSRSAANDYNIFTFQITVSHDFLCALLIDYSARIENPSGV